MTIPLKNTTIDIYSSDKSEPYGPVTVGKLIASNVPAAFEVPAGGQEQMGQRTENIAVIRCDPIDSEFPLDGHIIDKNTGLRFEINFVHQYKNDPPFDILDHIEFRVNRISGSTRAG